MTVKSAATSLAGQPRENHEDPGHRYTFESEEEGYIFEARLMHFEGVDPKFIEFVQRLLEPNKKHEYIYVVKE